MKSLRLILLCGVSLIFIGCATYPNYNIQDSYNIRGSQVVSQGQYAMPTAIPSPVYQDAYNPLFFLAELLSGASVFVNNNNWGGGGWGGGNCNPWIPNGPNWIPPQPGWNYAPCY